MDLDSELYFILYFSMFSPFIIRSLVACTVISGYQLSIEKNPNNLNEPRHVISNNMAF